MEGKDNHRKDLGKRGEDIACSLLENMGHLILERNWRSGHLEIDIISIDPEGIHFVEVKTRKENIQAPPQFNVDKTKQKRIARAALAYLNKRKDLRSGGMECCFDIIAITFQNGDCKTEWFPKAYIPIYV